MSVVGVIGYSSRVRTVGFRMFGILPNGLAAAFRRHVAMPYKIECSNRLQRPFSSHIKITLMRPPVNG